MKLILKIFLFVVSIVFTLTGYAQLNEGGMPWSVSVAGIGDSFDHITLVSPDADKLIREDAGSGDPFRNERFAILVPVNRDPLNSGTWEVLKDGGRIWRLQLSLRGSYASSLYFSDFSLPEGVSLFVYDLQLEQLKGAFTNLNNRGNGLFATELVPSGDVVLELNVPAGISPASWFTVTDMTYSYAGQEDVAGKGFGTSQFCEINVNCSPEGDDWQDEKRGIVRIQVRVNGSVYWCSGSMINNTSQDKTPYLLTADHCAYKYGKYATSEDLASWVFYYKYEAAGCDNPQFEPQFFSLTGCQKIANEGTHGSDGSDFYLVKLLDNIPSTYQVYFNGWSRVNVPSSSGVTIHHPDGDIKKISSYLQTPESSDWQNNGLDSHWEVFWGETENNWGVTEGGSSGAPLFDNQGRIVGTLTGGLASCYMQDEPDYFGKFYYHWDQNGTHDTLQLRPWLDPGNTGVLALGGIMMGEEELARPAAGLMNVFPNPVGETMNITFTTILNRDLQIEVIDLMGNVVMQEKVEAYSSGCILKVDRLEPGLYFIRGSGTMGSIVTRFMKK